MSDVGFSKVSDAALHAAARARQNRIDALCREAADLGEGWRVAVSAMVFELNPDHSQPRVTYQTQFLPPGAMPSGAGTWDIYTPSA